MIPSPPGHPLALAPPAPETLPEVFFPFAGKHVGYADLVETRVVHGSLFQGPCAI